MNKSSRWIVIFILLFLFITNKVLSQAFEAQSVLNLPIGVYSSVAWSDFNNDSHLDLIITGSYNSSKTYLNNGDNTFSVGNSLTGVLYSSVSWGDYDNDGFLDLLLSGEAYNSPIYYPVTKLYHNDNGTFTEQTTILTGVKKSSVAFGDYNNDGYSDILLTGKDNTGNSITKIYENHGDNTFTELTGITIPGYSEGSVAWGDYDNDGYLDILMTGISEYSVNSKIYHNNGNNTFTEQSEIQLTGVYQSSVAWGDYDIDGKLDILLTGYDPNTWVGISKVYHNNGNNSFTDIQASLPGIYSGSAAWGDYDNDDYADILLAAGKIVRVYHNNGDNTFTFETSFSFAENMFAGAWGDFDNNGNLDFIINGISGTKLYKNTILTPKTQPPSPENLTFQITSSDLCLKWDELHKINPLLKPYTYNLQLGTKSGHGNILTSCSKSDGSRRIVDKGNAECDTIFKLNYKYEWDTTYFARIQVIDKAFNGGEFSNEVQFTYPCIQSTGLNASIYDNSSILLKWERGNGHRCIVLAKEGTSGTATLSNNTTYYANPVFGEGSPIGSSDWYCMYKGTGDSAIFTGLNPLINYIFQVFELQGVSGHEIYNNIINESNIGTFSTGIFTEQSDISLTGISNGSAEWGDSNNDGYLDILLAGDLDLFYRYFNIYLNNKNNNFIKLSGSLPAVSGNNLRGTWGDFNNDGKLDVVLDYGDEIFNDNYLLIYKNNGSNSYSESANIYNSLWDEGYSNLAYTDYNGDGNLDVFLSSVFYTIIYRNDGSFQFTAQSGFDITNVKNGDIAWSDYDNDGDQDIFITGINDKGIAISILYNNNGNNIFIEQTHPLFPGVSYSSVAWGDYDNDDFLDLVLTGTTNETYSGAISKIYHNNGNGTFSETEIPIAFVSQGSVTWGDYDNDGYMDILITGKSSSNKPLSKIYHNNCNNTFSELTSISLEQVYASSGTWGDYDNDGDLDILLSGNNNWEYISRVYRNNLITKTGEFKENSKPLPPNNPQSQISTEGIKFHWNPVITDETVYKSISYNVKVGTTKFSSNICSSNADTSGFRLIPAWGNAQTDTTFFIRNLPVGKYYWQVQAVDQGYKGGAWSSVDSFEVKNTQTFFTFDNVCLGTKTHFTDQSVSYDVIVSWKWDFNDGSLSTIQHPSHNYSASGTYNVKLVITDTQGAKDSLIQAVIVKPKPLTDFTAPAVCQGTATQFTNTTGNNGLGISSWFWDFGDGQTSIQQQPPAHGYLGAADYTVQLKALSTNGCRDSITKTVTVGVYPVAAVTADAPLTFCKGDSVTLTVPLNVGYTYTWKLDNAAITGASSNKHVGKISGSYIVDVFNSKGNCLTTSSAVNILAQNAPVPPLISSVGDPTFCQGDSVMLSVTNTSGYSYQWKLNGGAIGTDLNQYSAKASGNYSLVVSNSLGCSANSTNSVDVYVNVKPSLPTVNISGPTTFCKGSSVELSVASASGYTYQWENNGSGITGATSGSYVANNGGVYSLKILNSSGCNIKTENVTVNVLTAPSAPTISLSGNTTFCNGDSVMLSLANTPGYTYQWKLNGGSVGTNSNQLVAKTTGSYDIVVSNSSGCSVSSLIPVAVVVNPLPAMSIITVKGEEKFCSGESTYLSVPANKDYIYAWKKGTSDLGLSTNSIDVTESGSYTVELDLAGCKLTAEPVAIEVVAKPARPDIDPGSYSPPMCLGENPLRLSVDNIVPGYNYQWYKNETPVGTEIFVDVVEAGNYYLEAVADICSSERSSLSVTFAPAPLKPEIIAKGPTVWYLSTTSKAASYKWYFNGTAIPDAKGSSYMAGQNFGIYRLAIANENGCYSFSDTLRIPTFRTTGIEDSDPFADVKIYPNPTTGLFTIEMDNNIFGDLFIDIFSPNGSKTLSIKFDKSTEYFSSEIDLSGQAEGMYLINLSLDKFRAVRKVLVE